MNKYAYVLDISGHNGEVDFAKVKASGIEGVMLKCSEGKDYLAPKFKPNYEKALAAGLKVGAYHFLRSNKALDAAKEGRWFGQCVEGLQLELGLALDIEHEGVDWDHGPYDEALTARDGYNIVNIFAQNVAKYGRAELYENEELYLYASIDYFKRFLQNPLLEGYPRWLSNPDKLVFEQPVQAVQYSWSGFVEGVEKAVDLNLWLEKKAVFDMVELLDQPKRFTILSGSAAEDAEAVDKDLAERPMPEGDLPQANLSGDLWLIKGSIGQLAVELELRKR